MNDMRAAMAGDEFDSAGFEDGMDMAAMQQFWSRAFADNDGKMGEAWADVTHGGHVTSADGEFATFSGEYQLEDAATNPYKDAEDAFERGKALFDDGENRGCVAVIDGD